MKFALYKLEQMSEELWRAFTDLRNARAIYDDPFFDPDFARLVGEVRGDTRFAVATLGEDIVGFWPLHLRPGGWSRPIGGPFSDWHGPILKQGSDLTPQAFLAGLGLAGMTTFALLPQAQGIPAGLQRAGANMSDISQGWDSYIEQQQTAWPKHFKKMRRVYRNVERDFSGHTFNWDDKSDSAFERLIEIKQAQFARTGLHDVLKSQWAQALLDRLRQFEGPRLRARLVSMNYGGEHAATELNLQSDTIMHGWLTGFERKMSSYSPGNMLIQEVLSHLSNEGIMIYDAGPGLDHYKRHYANFQLPVDSGPLRGTHRQYAPARVLGRVWYWGEAALPLKAGALMGRLRRRMDQISLAEPEFGGRLSGVFGALNPRNL